jgi:hypothetical protein
MEAELFDGLLSWAVTLSGYQKPTTTPAVEFMPQAFFNENRGFAKYGCAQALQLEREAYNVQNAYIVAYGRYMQVGISMQNTGCEGSASESDSRAAETQ